MVKYRNVLMVCTGLIVGALNSGIVKAEEFRSLDKTGSIDWGTSYYTAVDTAAQTGKPILVRITATWCGPCQQMKQLTFTDARVVKLTNSSFVPLVIDADQNPDLVSGFKIEAFPTTLVVAPDLTILKRLKGFQSASNLLSELTPIAESEPSDSHTNLLVEQEEVVSALDPENALRVAFDGYCLVSLLEETKVRKGNPEFLAEHKGQTVCFQTAEHRQRFLQDPDRYWPVADGQCLVRSRPGSNSEPGDPRMAVTWRGKIWLFSDRESQRRFIESPYMYSNNL